MTIINTSHCFIYVHIPKSAGTSVKHFFGHWARYCDVEIGGSADGEIIAPYYIKRFKLAKHSFAREIRKAVGVRDFEKFFKFSITRNPFSRTISTFKFLKYNWRAWRDSAVMDDFATLEEFVTSEFFKGPGPDRILMPQIRWLIDKMCVDHIGHVESLEQDLAEICKKLKLPKSAAVLEKRNPSKIIAGKEKDWELSGKAVDAIRRRYALDFNNLKYSRDPARASAPIDAA
jgi:hypothetical protein